jgi:hypothetical protein
MKNESEKLYNRIRKGVANNQTLLDNWETSTAAFKASLRLLEDNMLIGIESINNLFEPQEYWDIASFIPEIEKDVSIIRKDYVYDVIRSLGIASEEQISKRASISGVLTKVRVKEVLASLMDEEKILGGRFVENDTRFYYTTVKNYDDLTMLEKKIDSKVDYSKKEERERYYLLNPKDLALGVLKDNLYEQFGVSDDNYVIVLDQKIAAQCSLEDIAQKRMIINNIILAPWIHADSSLNYVINAMETIPILENSEVNSIVVEKINGMPSHTLVK